MRAVSEQLVGPAVIVAGVVAGAELHSLDAERLRAHGSSASSGRSWNDAVRMPSLIAKAVIRICSHRFEDCRKLLPVVQKHLVRNDYRLILDTRVATGRSKRDGSILVPVALSR